MHFRGFFNLEAGSGDWQGRQGRAEVDLRVQMGSGSISSIVGVSQTILSTSRANKLQAALPARDKGNRRGGGSAWLCTPRSWLSPRLQPGVVGVTTPPSLCMPAAWRPLDMILQSHWVWLAYFRGQEAVIADGVVHEQRDSAHVRFGVRLH